MCNIDRRFDEATLRLGLSIIGKAMEASLSVNANSDVLATATTAYQQGKITKESFVMIVNALDEHTYRTKAYQVNEPVWNREYLDDHRFLNQYRG